MSRDESIVSDNDPEAWDPSVIRLDESITQGAFAAIVGVSAQSVTRWIERGRLKRGDTVRNWLLDYTAHLRGEAARYTSPESQRLTRERAALAQAQREAQELKNAIARGEYAAIGLLEDVLATASAAVADRMDGLEGLLRKVAPELPEQPRDALLQAIASARNEWVRSTARVVDKRLQQLDQDDVDAPAPTSTPLAGAPPVDPD